MKKQLLALLVITTTILVSCSKKSDEVVKTVLPEPLTIDLKTLNTYIGKSYDVVYKELEKNGPLETTKLGDRRFGLSGRDSDKKLSVDFIESEKKISEILITYQGVVGGPAIGDPYETELWYYFVNKSKDLFTEPSSKIYIGSVTRIPASVADLIDLVKKYGSANAGFLATWTFDTSKMTVSHVKEGRFILQIAKK